MSDFPKDFSSEQILGILAQANTATAIHSTDEMIIEMANDAMIAIWGKDKGVIGKPLEEALPELRGQPFLKLLQGVLHTGITSSGMDTRADLVVDGELRPFYFDFEYRAIKNNGGDVICVLHTATDVTARYLSRLRELELESELQSTNEELASANEELAAANESMASANEELAATNEELIATNEDLGQSQQSLQQNQARLNSMVMTAPIGMTVLRGRDLVIEIANKPMCEIWNRTAKEAIGNKLLALFPELTDQPFPEMLLNVLDTGNRLALPETPVYISTPAGMVSYIVDFFYDPLYDVDGNVEAVLATVINVTEKVKARDELQKAKDTLKQAIDSAEMGTWSADIGSDALTVSEQGKKLHGIPHNKHFTLAESLKLIAPEQVEKVRNAIQYAIKTHNSFDIEYLVNPMDGSKARWLKSTGKTYYDDKDNPVVISGTMIDITESKAHDQQKDDFISIASHELKTPVTSLKASLQLLDRMKDNPSPQMLPKLIEQSNRSMDKISTLIEDLLNLSRMNEGQLKLDKSEFRISELLDGCCNHVRMAGKHDLVFEGDKNLRVMADEHRVDQVLVNMVNNAVKYAPNSNEIFLIVEKIGDMAKISVKDTGPGIPAEKQAHLFERYYRTDAAGYQNSGLGLGLFISAEIIRKHGGEIGVDSELGKGSTFWFTLPL